MISFGGREYIAGEITDYILTNREALVKVSKNRNRTFNKMYYFLPKEKEFCSCWIYENLIKELMDEMSPSLDYALEHSKYHEEEWYKNLYILNKQVAGWPEIREEPTYWKLLDLPSPIFHKVQFSYNLNDLIEEEKKFRKNILDFEIKLYNLIEKLGK